MEPIIIAEGIEIGIEIVAAIGGSALLSEALPFISRVKSNSTLQLVFNMLKTILSVFRKKEQKHLDA